MSDYFDRVERQIVRRVQEGAPRSARPRAGSGYLAMVAAAVVVVVVAGVFLLARGTGGENPAPAARPGIELLFTPTTIDGHAPGPDAIAATVQILRARLATAVPKARVSSTGTRIVVRVPNAATDSEPEVLALSAPGRLGLYDWEGSVITPKGKTLAHELAGQDPTALEMSQGSGPAAPGAPGAGGVPLGQALALAARLGAGTPRRVEYLGSVRLTVPAGYSVVEANIPSGGPTDRFYVLKNPPAMSNGAIADPRAKTDPNTRSPAVEFSFTASGRREFRAVTAAVARRGAQLSSAGQTLNQHFAVALDDMLLSVPFIDFEQYPDGISGDKGAEVMAGSTVQSARNLAILLRYGPLPVNLTATG
jgi:preprotein translocase subunit SecD